ncbi:MAG: YihY/virulence factor BrkB family protein [Clostridia bacterium]|nr:YihY/virulence factor BrkB family protein [Clostridia bacterium]
MKRLYKALKYFIRKINANRMGAYSAQSAFFMFLSMVPLTMLFLTIFKLFGRTADEIMGPISTAAPGILTDFLDSYLGDIMSSSGISITIISVLILLWSASKGVFAIIGGLNSVYELRENRNIFLVRLLSVLYTVAFLGILIVALILMVFGKTIADFLYSTFPNIKGLVYIISSLRFIIGFVFLVLFFTVIYKALPGGDLHFTEQIPGAVFCSAGWVVFSILFSFYIDNFSNYSNIYGSLTVIIVLLLWLYVCMYIMFIGAQINHILTSKIVKLSLADTAADDTVTHSDGLPVDSEKKK